MLVPHSTETGSSENEHSTRPRLETEPARGEDSKKVPAREEERVSLDGPDPKHDSVGPSSDLVGRFSFRAPVSEELPVGAFGVNLGAGPPFVRTVVPLPEVVLDRRYGTEARELARSGRALEGTRQHRRELHPVEPCFEPGCFGFTLGRQREVGHARVLARDGPGRLTVPREVYNRQSIAHD